MPQRILRYTECCSSILIFDVVINDVAIVSDVGVAAASYCLVFICCNRCLKHTEESGIVFLAGIL